MAEENELPPQQTNSQDPQITPDDHASFDRLADQVFDGKEPEVEAPKEGEAAKPDVVQAPEKPIEGTEKKVEPNATTKQPEPEKKVEPVIEQPKADAELDAIQPPKGISPKAKEGWEALRTVARSRGERVAALQAEIDALKPQVGKPDPALMERATTLEKELNAMKASFQNERSPEFIEKFDNRIKTNEETAVDVLSRNGLPEALIENIKKNGIRSIPSKQMTEWLSKLDVDDKKALEDAYTGNKSLSKERESALEEIRKNPEKYEAKVKAERTQQFQTYTKEMADYTQQVTKDLPWAKQQEIPADATPEIKARLEKENKLQKELEDVFQRSLYPSNATVRAQTALSACLAHKLALDLSDMQGTAKYYFEESKKLQAEIDTIKKAGITSRAGANVARSPNANTGTLESKLALSDDDAVEAGLREVGA